MSDGENHGSREPMKKINLSEKLATFEELWSPKIVGELNGQQVKVVKVQGEFVWHHHEREDELFLVLDGELTIDWRDERGAHEVVLCPGELVIVPRGLEHRPRASRETRLLLFEPASTRNTGNVTDRRTVERPDRI